MARLANSGVDDATLQRADGISVGQLGRLVARHRRLTPLDEAAAFRMRRIWFQPNLGNTIAHGSITMSGADVDVLLDAVDRRADEVIDPADPHRPRLEQRRVDALLSLALDTTSPTDPTGPAPRRLNAHIFVDAAASGRTQGETGAITRSGIKVGPNTLEEILCIGDTQTTVVTADGLRAIRTDGDRLPGRLRNFVFFRDGGCVADGCVSRYRLEPHHIHHRSRGGDHHPDNLALLCWFHHHVVIHQLGHRIDPDSPPGRRRFLPPAHDRGPPDN